MRENSYRPDLNSRWQDVVSLALLMVAVLLLFHTSPRAGDFWWSDAPRHAMDGAFYRDMARSMPLTHLKQWATDYYLQYPAITVIFYPPVFALVEALFFSIFGVSQAIAQLTISVFYLATAYGAYFLVKRWTGTVGALATALLYIGIPGMALWGRQVMLEIPAAAFLLWSAYFFVEYLETDTPRRLYLAVAFLLAGAYTKQTVTFILPCYGLTILYVSGWASLRRREIWWSVALLVVGLTPLAVFTWMWGRLNVQQAVGGDWVQYSRRSLGGWIYIGRQLPQQLGWPVLVLALVYSAGCTLWKRWRLAEPTFLFLFLWVITGYLFFTVIALKESRHSILIVFPLVLFSVLAALKIPPARIGPYVAIAIAGGVFAHTLIADRVPYVSGYRAAAQYVCSVAPPDSVVLFSGMRDGSFIFNVRSMPECKNLTVIRSDKLLLRVAVDREKFGVKELGVDEDAFKKMLQQYGVRYVVMEPQFWNDLQSMQMLVRVIHQEQFKLLTSIPVDSNRNHSDKQLDIYENIGDIAKEKQLLRIELPVSGLTVEGKVGKGK
jgi:4-amino-4-deoxy-L-arabinose transferase-like glycosyltransferase